MAKSAPKAKTPAYKLGGACSGVCANGFAGRNFDWFYDDCAAIVIKTPAEKGRHAVLGVSDGAPELTKDVMDSKKYVEALRYIGGIILDGINDAKLFVQTNLIAGNDIPVSQYTKIGAPEFNGAMVCRYILDNCATVEEAKTALTKINITPDSVQGIQLDLHWLICDAEGNTCVAEIVNNEVKFADEFIMTNYHLTMPLQLHADGLERYQLLNENYASVDSKEAMLNLMQTINYTNMYNPNQDPFWYSEYNGVDEFGDLNINSNPEDYADKIAFYKEKFENRERGDFATWQTVHTSVYDIENMSLDIASQEESNVNTYYLFEVPEDEPVEE